MKTNDMIQEILMTSKLSKKIRQSLSDLAANGYARTGKSDRSGKDIWTTEVANILRKNRIACKTGNDAARGGASGEFVVLTSSEYKNATYNELFAKGREYLSPEDVAVLKENAINEFLANPTFDVREEDDEHGHNVHIWNSHLSDRGWAYDDLARHNYFAFQATVIPAIVREFEKYGIVVTAEEINHNYDAWRNDFKSEIVTASGWAIFTPCGCNDLTFWAAPANEKSFTYEA